MTEAFADEFDFEGEDAGGRTCKKWGITLFLLAILGLAFIAGLVLPKDTSSRAIGSVRTETPRSAYLDIMAETHTGLRLARIVDFRKTYQNSPYTPYVNAQYGALKSNEEADWAAYTRIKFDPAQPEPIKTAALSQYVGRWGTYQRKHQLDAPNAGRLIADSVDFPMPRSKYQSGMPADHLAGDARAPIQTTRGPARTTRPAFASANTKTLRVKYAPAPKYPSKARRKKISAIVTVSLDIDDKGRVARARVIDVQARRYHKKFARAARYAAQRSRFYPRIDGGKAVAVSGYTRRYKFEIPR